MTHAPALEAALARVDRERLADICMAMVDIASPTGDEASLAGWLASELDAAAGTGTVQALDERQANAHGRLAGDGTGRSLMLYAPIDTLTTGDPARDLPWAASEMADHLWPRAVRDGDRISGLGAMNPKGHGACVLAAFEAVAAARVELRGDLVAAFGAGGMPTNAPPGETRPHIGHGVGCAYLLEQGVIADAAIIAKSGWAISWEEVGLAWCDIVVRGTHTYVGARHRLPYRNAIADAARVVEHLEAWFPTYAERHRSGLCAPQGIVAAVRAGFWHLAAVTPAEAQLRVDLRCVPDQAPQDACRELEACVAELDGIDADVILRVAIPGSRTDRDHWITRRSIAAWESVAGATHAPLLDTSGATDANILRHGGIPTARVGLPKVVEHGTELNFGAGMNTVDLDGMELLTRMLVTLAVDVGTTCADDLGGPA